MFISAYKSNLEGVGLWDSFGERWDGSVHLFWEGVGGWLVGLGLDVTAACVWLWYRKACVYFRALL